MFHRYIVLFFLLLTPGILLAQKSHNKGKATIVLPSVGTMIVNTYYVTDSSGAIVPKSVVDPEVNDDTLFVVQSGVQRLRRSNCVVIVAKSHPDTTLISYATNGDIFMRVLGKDSIWNRLPFGMAVGKKIVDTLPADSGNIYGRDYNMPHLRTTQVIGSDAVSIGEKSYLCSKLQIVDIRQYEGVDWLDGTLFWYAPEIGYLVRLNTGWNGKYFLNQQLKIWKPMVNDALPTSESPHRMK
jgi:hypothetical protein